MRCVTKGICTQDFTVMKNVTPLSIERNNAMCVKWDELKLELKTGCTCSWSVIYKAVGAWDCTILIHSKSGKIREFYYASFLGDFDFEYIRRKLETKKWNKFIHKPTSL